MYNHGMRSALVLALVLAWIGGCQKGEDDSSAGGGGGKSIRVTSTAFADNQPIPLKYSKYGDNLSPPLAWSGVPDAAKELALIVEDPDAPDGSFAHWVLYKIPPTVRELPEGLKKFDLLPGNWCQGKNDFGQIGYDGPQPPGGTHHYYFRIYAVDQPLGLQPGASKDQVMAAMKDHIVGRGEIMGTYTR